MSSPRTAAFLFVIFSALTSASAAVAQYSMDGKWGYEPGGDLDLVQSGGSLTWNGGSTPIGTIDESTGEFHLDFGVPPAPGCGKTLIDGFVALDSKTFTGTRSEGTIIGGAPHLLRCSYQTVAIQGSRCGNGEMDPGEVCDDDNARDGDCCSATCQYDAPGTACTSDHNQCTDDTCDAAGTCLHTNNTSPCTEDCMDGTCSAGDCILASPSAAGTACDDDQVCTVNDSCDGAGSCSVSEPRDCGACGVCDWMGCRSPHECELSENPSGPASLAMSIGDDPDDGRFSFKVKDVVPSEEVGDPTTTTRYTLCVAAYDGNVLGISYPLLAFELPLGGICGTRDCWKESGSGYRYKDKASSADGLSSGAVGRKGFKFKGRGALLPFDSDFPAADLRVQVLSDDGVTSRCREVDLTASTTTDDEYSGKFKPE